MVTTSTLVDVSPGYVVFGEDWGSHPSSIQHLARHLAAASTVLNVSAPGLRRPRLALYDARRVVYKAQLWMANRRATPVEQRGSVNVYTGFAVPAGGSAPVRSLNRHLLARGVRAKMSALGIERPVLFAASPMAAEVLGCLAERLVVYYVADDYLALPGIYRRYVGELERALLDRADVIFATSEVLCGAKQGRRGRPVLLPHGVDIAHWTPRGAAAPPELAGLPRPRIGFFGFLAPWVDDRLIVSVARAFSHGSVVLIGPAWAGVRVPTAPNIVWLGPRSYAELPRYAEHFDVALVPFRRDRLVSAVNPLKLLEYLALGLPVVSTPMALPAALSRMIHVAADTDAFIDLVRQALSDDTPDERSRRRAAAARESWGARVRTLGAHIDAALTGTVPVATDVTECSPTLSAGVA